MYDVEAWNPWRTLRACDDVIFGVDALPDGIRGLYLPAGKRSYIVVSSALDALERNAVLAHELIHREREGGCILAGMPEQYRAVACREERRIDREVARRLVPVFHLEAMRRIAVVNELTVEPWQVTERFYVPHRIAELAMAMHLERRLRLPDHIDTVTRKRDTSRLGHPADPHLLEHVVEDRVLRGQRELRPRIA